MSNILRSGIHHRAFTLIASFLLFLMNQSCSAENPATKPDHHTSQGFQNVYPFTKPSLGDFLKWRWQRSAAKLKPAEDYHFPLATNDPVYLKTNRSENTMTWIGHATLLLQINGINLLTDPHFSERASPVQWYGPKRVVAPGLSLEELPEVDLVVISHNHYDHLDKASVVELARRQTQGSPIFFVPLGLKSWFQANGVENVIELDWWQHHDMKNYRIYAVPLQHWSKRTLLTENDTLWAGWVIESGGFRFMFIGDTGYAPIFKEIGKQFGSFDLCAIPIGAYEPRWFMKSQHISPDEALQIHKDLRCRQSVGIHWGTFILTDEPLEEPPQKLAEYKPKLAVADEEFIVLQHGETRRLVTPLP